MKALPHQLSPDMRLLTLRDLMWLTGSLAIVIAPHALRAPWWLTNTEAVLRDLLLFLCDCAHQNAINTR